MIKLRWKHKVFITGLAGALLLIVLLLGSLAFSFQRILKTTEQQASQTATAIITLLDEAFIQIQSDLTDLAQKHGYVWTTNSIEMLADVVYRNIYVRETGFFQNGDLIGTSIQKFEPPVDISDPAHLRTANANGDIAILPPTVTMENETSIIVNYRMDEHTFVNALVDPGILELILKLIEAGTTSGLVILNNQNEVLIRWGESQALADPVHSRKPLGFMQDVLASASSERYRLTVRMRASPDLLLASWYHTLYTLAPLFIGILALFGGGAIAVARRFQTIESRLKEAIAFNEIVAFYQPLIDLETGRCLGAEALIRWQTQDRGTLSPQLFISAAETSGLILPMTNLMMRQIVEECAPLLAANPDTHIGINLCESHFHQPSLVEDMVGIFNRRIKPRQILLEITERSLVPDQDSLAVELVSGLRREGFRIAVDDFGTGYSSLSYLDRFKIDLLKIDKAFVDGISSATESSGLVDTVINIARRLNLDMIAEGIETPDQAEYLRCSGIRKGQGYLYSKPVPFAEFEAIMRQRNQPAKEDAHD